MRAVQQHADDRLGRAGIIDDLKRHVRIHKCTNIIFAFGNRLLDLIKLIIVHLLGKEDLIQP